MLMDFIMILKKNWNGFFIFIECINNKKMSANQIIKIKDTEYICGDCKESIDGIVYYDDEMNVYYCSYECFANYREDGVNGSCDECSDDALKSRGGQYLCQSCYEGNIPTVVCTNCSNLFDEREGYYDEDEAKWICEMCLCPCCYTNPSTVEVGGITYCVRCAEDINTVEDLEAQKMEN